MRFEYKGRGADFSRIVAYGCSYTEGHEILDYEHEYKNLKTPDEIDSVKTQYQSSGKSIYDFYHNELVCGPAANTSSMMSRTRARAWPAMLAKKFGVKYINRGYSGTGLWNFIHTYEIDKMNGLIKDDDLVIFGLTTASRFFWMPPVRGEYAKGWSDVPYTLMPGTKYKNVLEHLSPKFLELFFTEYTNPIYTAAKAYHAIKYMDYLSYERNGLALIVPAASDLTTYGEYREVPVHPHIFYEMAFESAYISEPFRKYFEKNLLSYIDVPCIQNTERLERTGGFHSYFHPKIEAHEEFVNDIYEAIKC